MLFEDVSPLNQNFHNGINKPIRLLEHCSKVEMWQGLPHIKKVKWHQIEMSVKISLFIQFTEKENSLFILIA